MAVKLFGFKIGRDEEEQAYSFVPPEDNDGAVTIAGGGAYGTYVDLDGYIKNEAELIKKYREMAMQPECDTAVDDIVNEAIVFDSDEYPVNIVLDNLEQNDNIKEQIRKEFNSITRLLDFGNMAYDIFRRWYVDGRLYYHLIIDTNNPKSGLQELRYIDPRKIKKVREQIKEQKRSLENEFIAPRFNEYYLYSDKGFTGSSDQGLKVAVDSICFVNSGVFDKDGKQILSNLHKAIKPLNQLRMLEDAVVIYRISRAPERRLFYIDVGNLPKMKAEQYLRDIMTKYKNKIVYDASTGEIKDDRRFQTMMEDYWLPRREGGRGTEISTLPGGQNLGEIEDVQYFQKKLYKALNVPVSRLDNENGFAIGRASEITRDELKFTKFISRLRMKFSSLFDELLGTQLVLKGICTRKEWLKLKEQISYDFISDTHFSELKDAEILRERLNSLREMDEYVGKYFSQNYVRRYILRQSEEDIKIIDSEIEQEIKDNKIDDPNEDDEF